MKQGERYGCECCNATLVVEQPCTCDQVQDLVCSCGAKMNLKS